MEPALTFFSYSRKDSDFVLNLAKDLRAQGTSLWLDQLDIVAGSHWDSSIEKALNAASQLVVILSPSSVNSVNVKDEVAFALENGKVVIPVLISECKMPFRLNRLQWIDFTKNYSTGLNHLIKVLDSSKNGGLEIEEELGFIAKLKTFYLKYKLISASITIVLIFFTLWGIKKYSSDRKTSSITLVDPFQKILPSASDTEVVIFKDSMIDENINEYPVSPIIPLPENERVSFDSNIWYRFRPSWPLGDTLSMGVKYSSRFYTPVELDPSTDRESQAWKIIGLDNGYFKLINKSYGTRFNLSLIKLGDYYSTRLDNAGDFIQQLWKITRISDIDQRYKITSYWKGDHLPLDVRNDEKDCILQLDPLKDTIINGILGKTPYGGQIWLINSFY